jgi:hypothetical protein
MGKLTDVVEHMARVPVRMTAAYIPQLDAERPLKETVATTLIIFFLFFLQSQNARKGLKLPVLANYTSTFILIQKNVFFYRLPVD